MMDHDHGGGKCNHDNTRMAPSLSKSSSSSSSSSSVSQSGSCCLLTYDVRRQLRLRRNLFLGFMALGYTAITIAIYRNILILVHGTDFLTAAGMYQQTYYWIADFLDDHDHDAVVVNVVNNGNASHSHDDYAPRNDSATLTTSITTTATTEIHQQNASAQAHAETNTPKKKKKKKKKAAASKFFMLQIPELTSDLVEQYWDKAYAYGGGGGGEKAAVMNEDLAEIWLHRGFSNFTYEQGQTMDPNEADVFFIPAYLHGRDSWIQPPPGGQRTTTEQKNNNRSREGIVTAVMNALIDKTKPHVLLIPTRDKTLGNRIGYRLVAQTLWDQGGGDDIFPQQLYSVGFERNSWWQVIPTDRIIPIPYVVKPQVSAHDMPIVMFEQANRTENFVFYAAHPRPSAIAFAGCNRSTVLPLQGQDNMEILLLPNNNHQHQQQRLSQERYNHRMLTSDYCLVTCGDTPTSRSLASAMVAGCIPLRIGSWWRAICEEPCKKIHIGFNVASKPHFPFANEINYSLFPEMNQLQFDQNPIATLAALIQNTTRAQKDAMRVEMKRVQSSWIYGWGNPINSTSFGNVYKYLWKSIIHELEL